MTTPTRLFLTVEEVAELTGIRGGRKGYTRDQLQVNWLRTSGLPFIVNARGRPIVTVAAVEGRAAAPAPKKAWASNAALDKAA